MFLDLKQAASSTAQRGSSEPIICCSTRYNLSGIGRRPVHFLLGRYGIALFRRSHLKSKPLVYSCQLLSILLEFDFNTLGAQSLIIVIFTRKFSQGEHATCRCTISRLESPTGTPLR